jgi:16S rRNA processing protein RimM
MKDPRWRTISHFVQIGSTGKVRGRDGEIKFYIDEKYLTAALEAEFIFIEIHGNKVPLEIESVREVQDILIKLRDVNDPSTASRWSSAPVFLPADEVFEDDIDSPEEHLEYGKLKGYTVVDEHLGKLGVIREVKEFPQQEMAVIEYEGKDVLLPLNPVFITGIDAVQKLLSTDLPDGLLEI